MARLFVHPAGKEGRDLGIVDRGQTVCSGYGRPYVRPPRARRRRLASGITTPATTRAVVIGRPRIRRWGSTTRSPAAADGASPSRLPGRTSEELGWAPCC